MTILVWRYNLSLEYRQLNIYFLQNVYIAFYLYNMGNQIITFSKYLSKASSSGNHSGYPTSLTIASALTCAKSYKGNILCRLFQLFNFGTIFWIYIYRLFTQEITWVARFIHLDSINNSLKAFLMSSTIDPAWNGMKASM